MIEIKFGITINEDEIHCGVGKIPALVNRFNSHLERMNESGQFEYVINGDKKFVVFVPDWLDAGSQVCNFAWTSEDRDDVTGFLESLAKFPQIFCKVIPALPL